MQAGVVERIKHLESEDMSSNSSSGTYWVITPSKLFSFLEPQFPYLKNETATHGQKDKTGRWACKL